jgi:hypothetical protein
MMRRRTKSNVEICPSERLPVRRKRTSRVP